LRGAFLPSISMSNWLCFSLLFQEQQQLAICRHSLASFSSFLLLILPPFVCDFPACESGG
jgi:hypothetical protein